MKFDDDFDKWWNSTTTEKRREFTEKLTEQELHDLDSHWHDSYIKGETSRTWKEGIFGLIALATIVSIQAFSESIHKGFESFGLVAIICAIIFSLTVFIRWMRK